MHPSPSPSTIRVKVRSLAAFDSALARLSKKAKRLGLAAALPVCHRIALKKATAEAEREAARARSQHVGEVGKRQPFAATVKRVIVSNGYYGINVLTIMEDDDGNVLIGKDLGANEGDRVSFVATVKEHSEYNGISQTKLLRAAKVEIAAAA